MNFCDCTNIPPDPQQGVRCQDFSDWRGFFLTEALILMSRLVQAEIFTGDVMVLNAYESDSIKVLLPIIWENVVISFVPVSASALK